jgi:hypothetical protein
MTMTTKTGATLKSSVLAAVTAANKAPWTPSPSSGCGRAYVVVTADRATVNAVSAACKTLGLMFLRKAYGTSGNAIYIGYDNADGRALGRSKAFADALAAQGVPCYSDAVGD